MASCAALVIQSLAANLGVVTGLTKVLLFASKLLHINFAKSIWLI